MSNSLAIVHGKRRFSCLHDGMVRLEFCPGAKFQDEPSLMALRQKALFPFQSVHRVGDELRLSTSRITIVSRRSDVDFRAGDLEIHWKRHGRWELWQPGDRDYGNLGGCLRSLDRFTNEVPLHGVHPAGMESPDTFSCTWLCGLMNFSHTWFLEQYRQEENLAPVQKEGLHACVKEFPERVPIRVLNQAREQYRYPPGLLSQSGYVFLNDSEGPVLDADGFPVERQRPGSMDGYFLCADDHREMLRLFWLLSGRAPLPTIHTFGIQFCRWPAYTDLEARCLIERFESEGLPLTSLIIDMEWHQKGWCQWDWNPDYYPHPEEFFRWCREKDIETPLNVHPQHIQQSDSHYQEFCVQAGLDDAVLSTQDGLGKRLNLCDRRQAEAFMRVCHEPMLEQGASFWWLDGVAGRLRGASAQLVNNLTYFNVSRRKGRRGMLLSRYGGLGSHRYGCLFTGDNHSQWGTLNKLCEYTIRAGQSGMAYISHEVGGFYAAKAPLIDPELYLRWLQFGVFQPMLRFHSCPGNGSREPWDYGEAIWTVAQRWLKWRNQMVPYLYASAAQHHLEGIPLVRGLYLDCPEDPQSYVFDEYMLGDALLVAPIVEQSKVKSVYLPQGTWYGLGSSDTFRGGHILKRSYAFEEYPVFVRAGSVIPLNPEGQKPHGVPFPEILLDVYPGEGRGDLYEDDGKTECYVRGESRRTAIIQELEERTLSLRLSSIGGAEAFARFLSVRLWTVQQLVEVRINGKQQEIPMPAAPNPQINLGHLRSDQDCLIEFLFEAPLLQD